MLPTRIDNGYVSKQLHRSTNKRLIVIPANPTKAHLVQTTGRWPRRSEKRFARGVSEMRGEKQDPIMFSTKWI